MAFGVHKGWAQGKPGVMPANSLLAACLYLVNGLGSRPVVQSGVRQRVVGDGGPCGVCVTQFFVALPPDFRALVVPAERAFELVQPGVQVEGGAAPQRRAAMAHKAKRVSSLTELTR